MGQGAAQAHTKLAVGRIETQYPAFQYGVQHFSLFALPDRALDFTRSLRVFSAQVCAERMHAVVAAQHAERTRSELEALEAAASAAPVADPAEAASELQAVQREAQVGEGDILGPCVVGL